jgi:hypothetical protein
VVFPAKGILGLGGTYDQDYENWGHSISPGEINCPEKLIRSFRVTDYSKAGEVSDLGVDYGADGILLAPKPLPKVFTK